MHSTKTGKALGHKKRKMSKMPLIVACVAGVLVIVLVPFALLRVLGDSSDSSAWLGFFGSYCGGIVGAIAALIGISCTIRFTRNESAEERRLQWMPYLDVECEHTKEFVVPLNTVGYILLSRKAEHQTKDEHPACCVIRLNNVGNGAAVQFNVTLDGFNETGSYQPMLVALDTKKRMCSNLEAHAKGAISMCVYFNYRLLSEEDLIETPEGKDISFKAMKECVSFKFDVNIEYQDVLGNTYLKVLHMSLQTGVARNNESNELYYAPEFYLNDAEDAVLIS